MQFLLFVVLTFSPREFLSQQIANYFTNGSFEQLIDNNQPHIEYKAVGWSCVDSIKPTAGLYNIVWGNAPHNVTGYQCPKYGTCYIRMTLFCTICPSSNTRSNVKNRLRSHLQAGSTYCVKMFVNTQDSCPLAVDGFGIYFGDSSVDTIVYNARLPLTFLSPQMSNPSGNVINDTMNWVPITGTFVANGTEKYAVVANFKSDAATTLSNTGIPVSSGTTFSEYFMDGFSCIDIDLPAFAGSDKSIVPGDSVFIGREPDMEIDQSCLWYKLPGSTPIATVAGLYVKPVTTSTYVVKQQLWCSGIKYDTVVVHMNLVGLEKLNLMNENLKIYPVPANDKLELSITNEELFKEIKFLSLYNSLGQIIWEEEIDFKDKRINIITSDLSNGVYSLVLKGQSSESLRKQFVISR